MKGTKDNGKQRSCCVVVEYFDYDTGYRNKTMGMRKYATAREAFEAAEKVAGALAEFIDSEAKFGWGGYEIYMDGRLTASVSIAGSDCRHLEGIHELNEK